MVSRSKKVKYYLHLLLCHLAENIVICFVDVTFIDAVSGEGCVQVTDVINAIRPTTCLITVMLANNETGTIQVLTGTDSHCSQFILWRFVWLQLSVVWQFGVVVTLFVA